MPVASKTHWAVHDATVHLLSLVNTVNTKIHVTLVGKNAKMEAPAQLSWTLLKAPPLNVPAQLDIKPPFVKLPCPTILVRTVRVKMGEPAAFSPFQITHVPVPWVGPDPIVKKLITVPMILVDLTEFVNLPATPTDVIATMALMDLIVSWTLMNVWQNLVVIMETVPILTDLTNAHASKVTRAKTAKASMFHAIPILVKMAVIVARSTHTTTNVLVLKALPAPDATST